MRSLSRHAAQIRLALLPALASLALLTGCQSVAPTGPIVAPTPVETQSVKLVKSAVFSYDRSITVATAFEQYGLCVPVSRVWEEIEGGVVQFSCRMDDASILQFEFNCGAAAHDVPRGSAVAEKPAEVALRMVTFTSQNDAEFAGVSLRSVDAADMLEHVYQNEPLF